MFPPKECWFYGVPVNQYDSRTGQIRSFLHDIIYIYIYVDYIIVYFLVEIDFICTSL